MKTALLKRLMVVGLTTQCLLALATATGPKPEPVDCSKTPGTQSELNVCAFQDFEQATGLHVNFVQDNHSRSAKGVLRGLHSQYPLPQGKLVTVLVI